MLTILIYVLIAIGCAIAFITLVVIAFIVYFIMNDDELWFDHMERVHGLRDNE